MKKCISVILAVLLMCSLTLQVSAADGFVPSISYKDHPEVVGEISLIDDAGNTVQKLDSGCLEITAVSEAINTAADKRTDAEKLLVETYEQLSNGTMKLPFEGDKAERMVIRELLDASLICGDIHKDPSHVEELAKPGVYIKISFDLGVQQAAEVEVMAYVDGQWAPIKSVESEGDGVFTCIFDELCPVAFCVEEGYYEPLPPTGDVDGLRLVFWFVLLAASFTAIVLLLLSRRSKKHRHSK